MVELDFSGNVVAMLGPASLSELADHPAGPGIVTLSLTRNRITAVLPGALGPLPNLVTLDLGHNRLSQLAAAMFPAGCALRTVDLRRNRIRTVEAGLPTALAAMTTLRMDGNPAACSLTRSAPRVLACRCPGDPDAAAAAGASSDGVQPGPSRTFCPPEEDRERLGCQVQTSKLGTVIVDCRGLGWDQFPTTAEVPAGVTELLISNNAIKAIGPGALSRFPKLKNLFIDQNEIEHVHPGELSSLVELEMDGNPSTCKWATPRWKGVRCRCTLSELSALSHACGVQWHKSLSCVFRPNPRFARSRLDRVLRPPFFPTVPRPTAALPRPVLVCGCFAQVRLGSRATARSASHSVPPTTRAR